MLWDRKWLVNFNAGKSQLVSFDQSNNTGAIDGSVLEVKSSFKMLGLTFSSKLDWGLQENRSLDSFCEVSSPEVALYLCKSIIRPCMKFSCHVWAGAPTCYLQLLDKLQN